MGEDYLLGTLSQGQHLVQVEPGNDVTPKRGGGRQENRPQEVQIRRLDRPTSAFWEAAVLPLNYTRSSGGDFT